MPLKLFALIAVFGAAFLLMGSALPRWVLAAGVALRRRLDALDRRYAGLGAAQSRSARLAGLAALGGGVLGALLGGIAIALAGALLGGSLPWLLARQFEERRLAQASGQLAAVLEGLAAALRAGQSLNQALQSAAAEAPQPVAAFLEAPASQIRLGAPPELALERLSDKFSGRLSSGDWRMLATAVAVTRGSGGNLSEILDQLADTVRERQRLRAQVEAMTAQGKMSAWIVGLLPLGLLLAMQVLDPGMMKPLFHTSRGLGLLLIGLGMELAGLFILRRMMDIDV